MVHIPWKAVLLLSANIAIGIAVILLNKAVFRLGFQYPTVLSAIHYIMTWSSVEILSWTSHYQRIPWSEMPISRSLIYLAITVGISVPLNNLSLELNSVGTYQLLKLLVTPVIVLAEYLLNNRTISRARVILLATCIVGVAIASITDVELRPLGLFVGLLFVPVSALYKVLWKKVQTALRVDTLSFIHRVFALSSPVLLVLVIFDPPGLLASPFLEAPANWGLLSLSGLSAVLLNISSFGIVMEFSPLTHQILGLFKIALTVLAGYFLFASNVSPVQTLGAFVAMASLYLYTKTTTEEEQMATKRATSSSVV